MREVRPSLAVRPVFIILGTRTWKCYLLFLVYSKVHSISADTWNSQDLRSKAMHLLLLPQHQPKTWVPSTGLPLSPFFPWQQGQQSKTHLCFRDLKAQVSLLWCLDKTSGYHNYMSSWSGFQNCQHSRVTCCLAITAQHRRHFLLFPRRN